MANHFIQELTADKLIKYTAKGNNEIYIVNAHNAPLVMHEIGRLREESFSDAGGGTGKTVDIDEYDTSENCYDQLLVFNRESNEIIGGYRFIDGKRALTNPDHIALSTLHYFDFSDEFIREYLPYTIELGRSWLRPEYQSAKNFKKGLYALDNIWEGLGAIVKLYPDLKYFFGKITMYPSYDREARDILLSFMHHFFSDKEGLVRPKIPMSYVDHTALFEGLSYKEAFRKVNKIIRAKGTIIPPLFNIYMNLSPTMKMFGTALNNDFGEVEESAIMITVEDVYDDKKARYVGG